MAEIRNELLVYNDGQNKDRLFLPSTSINIFPCSRRGQSSTTDPITFYDPEARLNTERTNRIGTAINGLADSFIDSYESDTLVFVLGGYRIEIANIDISKIAEALGVSAGTGTIYAHLSLHDKISLNSSDYSTEILYQQYNDGAPVNSLDIPYEGNHFFVGVSFTIKSELKDTITRNGAAVDLRSYDLALFSRTSNTEPWQLVKTSLLPSIRHGYTDDSIDVGELNAFKFIGPTAEFGSLKAESITVTDTEGNAAVTIQDSGIYTPSIEADSLQAKGLSVGNSISIEDAEKPGEKTTISSTEVSTTGTITASALQLKNGANSISVPALTVDDRGDGIYQLQFTFGQVQDS